MSVQPQLDLKDIATRRDEHEANIRARRMRADVAKVVAQYERHCSLTAKGNRLRQERNQLAKQMKKSSAEEREHMMERGSQVKLALAEVQEEERANWGSMMQEALQIPNLTDATAPVDKEKVVELVGAKREFSFHPKPHEQLAAALGLTDFEAASKVVGPKFAYLKRAAALLELALQQWAVKFTVDKGFTPVVTPDLAHSWVVEGCGFNPRGEHTQVYKVTDTDLCLVGTAEIALAGLVSSTMFEEAQLPVKLVGCSHCFRTEAGAAGAAEKGLYRLHQFTKVEMFVVSTEEDSPWHLDEIVQIERQMLDELGLHFRVLDMPPHELGASAHRKYDMEAWMPGKGEYGEVTSASNCTDYQARRLGIKVKRSDGNKQFVHTLNGTAAAIPRLIISILETHQNEDGTVNVPKVLQPYVGMDCIRLEA